jgi:ubiquinone/menaquinone biosynthesis C-methylase UbiE
MNWVALVGGALLLAAFLYWQLIIAEGAYLGRRAVIWLYDLYAPRYDSIKQFNNQDEAWFLSQPLLRALKHIPAPLVLDVATGTGRIPLALFRQADFEGRVIALDLSRRMLRYAASNTAAYQDRLTLLWQNASHLPFPDNAFDAVTCLEALEFLPDAQATLSEIVRVLRPGGVLLTSNRTGSHARWMPGRTMSRQAFTELLESLSLSDVRVGSWQVDYDIAWARKPGQSHAAAPAILPALLRCPRCFNGPLVRQDWTLRCAACNQRYPIADDGVVEMGW